MNLFTRSVRVGIVFALGIILVMTHTAIESISLEAQQEEECIESLGPCVDLRYHYEHVCEGSICYTALEMCCLEDIVVR
ncbi:MAG: hypothetical protein OXI39_00555 [Gemmatimonadota bacterium]|uniref:hypothetical protein n=1 Tax=Candidatus Palauibacter scopulicola TaxID=3056741 RepID=UPI00239C40BA|nr:hypothetical protein [Candidatus Palauibacter scopulicola]MDE2661482.1 hypothetical protein [Candidatus Palauibacter scopulicola]